MKLMLNVEHVDDALVTCHVGLTISHPNSQYLFLAEQAL
jgi:hypothetical protein